MHTVPALRKLIFKREDQLTKKELQSMCCILWQVFKGYCENRHGDNVWVSMVKGGVEVRADCFQKSEGPVWNPWGKRWYQECSRNCISSRIETVGRGQISNVLFVISDAWILPEGQWTKCFSEGKNMIIFTLSFFPTTVWGVGKKLKRNKTRG